MNCNASCGVVVSRGTTSTLDPGALAGQDRRRAAAFRKSYLMRIRRRDKDPAETAGPGESEVVLYDYDEDGPGSPHEVTILSTEPVLADPAPPSQPQTPPAGAQAAHVAAVEPPSVAEPAPTPPPPE